MGGESKTFLLFNWVRNGLIKYTNLLDYYHWFKIKFILLYFLQRGVE